MNHSYSYRSPLEITLATWKALFLREAVARLSAGRGAWVWLLLEPVLHFLVPLFIMTRIHVRSIGGIDTGVWLVIGLVYFFLFKRTALQAQNAINANRALFTYRQVKPIDTIFARASLEAVLTVIIGLILVAVTSLLLGLDFRTHDAIVLLLAFLNLWLLALGLGIIAAISIIMVPETDKIIMFVNMPMYLLSGVILPISAIPEPFQQWLMLNPIVHSIEPARKAMSNLYHTDPSLNIFYTTGFALFTVFIGLSLYKRFEDKVYRK